MSGKAANVDRRLATPLEVRELSGAREADRVGPDDGELVRRALRGEPWAEEALYRRHVRTIVRVVRRLLARSHESEDVVQDTFLWALRDLRKLRQADSFGSWLTRIAVRLVHRRFRRRRLLRSLGLDREQDDATLLSEVDPAASPETCAEIASLDAVLAELPAPERIAWVLRYVEGYPLEEVAAACGCSLATAKRRIGRARTRVLAHVDLDDGDGE
jgi:RNA polymerase sigma-70 factor, ECF subfamily